MSGVVSKFLGVGRKLFGSRNDRIVKDLWKKVHEVNAFEPDMKSLSDEALSAKTAEFRDRLSHGETLDQLLPEAFAVVRESSFRHLRTPMGQPMRHFDVQILGGIVLHEGKIAEMGTGEGKTLVATLPSYLNALEGKGVHLITVNDYLAQRDRDWMAPVFESLGLKTGAIHSGMENEERRECYGCDITYGTNNEFGFDYLRDNMKVSLQDQVQRGGRHYAIVDEVDSILVDEARTPLIISGLAERTTDKYYTANRVAKRMTRGRHFEVKEKERAVYFTEEGIEFAEKLVGVDSFYSGKNMEWPHLVEQSLRAHHLFSRDVDYVVRDAEVVIVDEFTGRLMEGRSWSEGLHQAVEAKENLSIRQENQTLATITLQNYFKLYDKLSGMTGTAMTEAGEFWSIYELDVVAIPTNRPIVRVDHADVVYRTSREKYKAIIDEIEDAHNRGCPTLVGTTSIERSETISRMLTRRGIQHSVLNAKQHEREAEIIKEAGQPGRVTLSTNMAGRGTDIVLGPGVVESGGLHVVGTERHEARRIDNQLRGRCARQGDPGESKFFLSLEDDLMRRFASERVSGILKKLGMKEGEEISHPWVTKSILRAQKKVEAYHFDIRKNLLEYDGVMNEQRLLVYEQRQEVLEGEGLGDMVRGMTEKSVRARVEASFIAPPPPEASGGEVAPDEEAALEEVVDPLEGIKGWVQSSYDIALDLGDFQAKDGGQQTDRIVERILEAYDSRYESRREENGEEMMKLVESFVLLKMIDDKWKDHLLAMDHLRHSIGLRGYAQIDPKIAYKQEGYQMFSEMLDGLYKDTSEMVLRVRVRKEDESGLGTDLDNAQYQHESIPAAAARPEEASASGGGAEPAKPVTIRNKDPKVGRNDPCPCGSGKKFKKCCGVSQKA